jgi:hypothetical protein
MHSLIVSEHKVPITKGDGPIVTIVNWC